MKLRTRVLSLVLAGSMALSVFPVSAFAAENYTGGIIALSESSADSSPITQDTANQTYTQAMLVAADNITLTGCTFEKGAVVVGNNVTFKDCTVDGDSLSVMSLTHYFLMLNASFSNDQLDQLAKQAPGVADRTAASLTLNGGTFKAPVTTTSENCPLTIKDGTFNGSVVTLDGNITIDNGTFHSHVATAAAAGQAQAKGTLTINGGVFAEQPAGASASSELYKMEGVAGATFNGLSSPIYVANKTATPRITMNYNGNTDHKIVAWRIDIDNAAKNHISTDGTNIMTQYLLQTAKYDHSTDLRTISLDCVRTVAGQEAFTADITVTPVLDVLPSELSYTAPTESQPASVSLGSGMPSEIAVVSHYKNTKTGETTDTYPTKPGTYQISVNMDSTNPPAEETAGSRFANRLFWNGAYHQLPFTGQEPLTSENWQFTIEAQKQPTIDPGTGAPVGPTEGEGWTYDKKDGETTGTITTNEDAEVDLSNQAAVKVNVDNKGTLVGGTFERDVTNDGSITGGTFEGDVTNDGTISGGTFNGEITGSGSITGGTFTGNVEVQNITGGVFAGTLPENVASVKVIVTGGATVNGINNSNMADPDSKTQVSVVNQNPQTLTLAFPDTSESHEFYAWKMTSDDESSSVISSDKTASYTVATDSPITLTPVVVMNAKDLNSAGQSKITGVTVASLLYYPVDESGNIIGEGTEEYPTDEGRYILVAALELGSAENDIALFAAQNTDLTRVVEQNGIGYYVPETLTLDTIVKEPDVPPVEPGDGSGAGAALILAGGAALGVGAAYYLGTTAYLNNVLPEGTAIPTNKAQLAQLLWTAAGKPEPASTALFADISAETVESQKAARWCVEQGLMSANGDSFKPNEHTFRPQVIKAWNDLQAKQKAN